MSNYEIQEIPLVACLTFWYDETHWFPFIEDENCNITGPGHQNRTAFAQAVDAYDVLCDGDQDEVLRTDPEAVSHEWIHPHEDDNEKFVLCDFGEEDAIPVTTYWGQA